jgi:hypothetical protein
LALKEGGSDGYKRTRRSEEEVKGEEHEEHGEAVTDRKPGPVNCNLHIGVDHGACLHVLLIQGSDPKTASGIMELASVLTTLSCQGTSQRRIEPLL